MDEKELSLSVLEFDPSNARRRTERSAEMIRSSLNQFGPLRSLVGQKLPDGRIVVRAGNGTLEEAGQIGIDKIRVVERKPDELVVVVADDLSEDQWKQYAIADNRASDLSEWDETILAETHQDIDLSEWFDADRIAGWSAELPDGETWGEAFAGVPEGDRTPFQQLTFTLHDDQAEQVKAALEVAKSLGAFDTQNKNSNGNALSRICEIFLTEYGDS